MILYISVLPVIVSPSFIPDFEFIFSKHQLLILLTFFYIFSYSLNLYSLFHLFHYFIISFIYFPSVHLKLGLFFFD